MADPAAPQTPHRQTKPRNKIRAIRLWLWVIALLFASMFLLSQCAMSKSRAKNQIIESCIQNGPFNPVWESELAQYGLSGQSDKIIKPYCVCMWGKTLEAMSTDEIKAFSQMQPVERLRKLGGEKNMVARHQQCLRQQKKS